MKKLQKLSITAIVILILSIIGLGIYSNKQISTKEIALQDCRDSLEISQNDLKECRFYLREHLKDCSYISYKQIKKYDGRYIVLHDPYTIIE